MIDRVTEQCSRVRDQIVKRQGGLDGFFDNLEKLDRERLAAQARRKRSATKASVKKSPTKKSVTKKSSSKPKR